MYTCSDSSNTDREKLFPGNCPAIGIITEGEFKTCGKIFKKGESFFIPAGTREIYFNGNYSLFAACSDIKHQQIRRLMFSALSKGKM
jgi:mannose-6-phosphate isomerase class I